MSLTVLILLNGHHMPPLISSGLHTHTYTHTHTHKPHTHTHATCTHALMHVHAHTSTRADTHTHTCKPGMVINEMLPSVVGAVLRCFEMLIHVI